MHLNPYGTDAVVMAVSLVNEPPASARELQERCVAAGLVLERPITEADLEETRAFLRSWTAVVEARDAATRAGLLNVLLAGSTAHPRLTDHAGGWHLHYRDDDLGPAGVLRAVIAAGTALHLVGRGMDRLGRCAADGCGRVYADVSRAGTQRYCSPACANRSAVRRHRARAAEHATAPAASSGRP